MDYLAQHIYTLRWVREGDNMSKSKQREQQATREKREAWREYLIY